MTFFTVISIVFRRKGAHAPHERKGEFVLFFINAPRFTDDRIQFPFPSDAIIIKHAVAEIIKNKNKHPWQTGRDENNNLFRNQEKKNGTTSAPHHLVLDAFIIINIRLHRCAA